MPPSLVSLLKMNPWCLIISIQFISVTAFKFQFNIFSHSFSKKINSWYEKLHPEALSSSLGKGVFRSRASNFDAIFKQTIAMNLYRLELIDLLM